MAVGGRRPALRSACCRRQWHLHPASARFRWDGENGPTLLIQTVEQLTAVRIDHYAAIDSDGLIQGPTTWASTGDVPLPNGPPPAGRSRILWRQGADRGRGISGKGVRRRATWRNGRRRGEPV